MTALPGAIATSLDILFAQPTVTGRRTAVSLQANIPAFIEILEQEGVAWCLAGAHAVGLYTEPRATQDFDFIVDDRKLKRLLPALQARFGDLGVQDVGAAVRLMALSVDLIRASAHPLFRASLQQTHLVESWRVPRVEVLIALKFLSATSAWRGANRKRHDLVDLVAIYEVADPLDRAQLDLLADLVYPRASQELNEILGRVDRGEPIAI